MGRFAVGFALVAITLLTFFRFPGHTYLQQDTQIYNPILEHLWDDSVLRNDILVQRPHVAFTLYDEVALTLRKLTGLSFERVLELEQIVFRGLGLWGIYLIATALRLSPALALLVTAIWSLGATIVGPAVLTLEYEPVPRGFAVPLLLLAVGLLVHGHLTWAGVAASAAFLIHPPTVYPFYLLYAARALWPGRRSISMLVPLLASAAILFIASRFQSGITESQEFFARITPEIETLQRVRASYNWISIWWRDLLPQYVFLFAAAMLACRRLRNAMHADLKLFLIGLPVIGMLSMPLSWLLLEYFKWALIPQFQPMRALLFVTAMAVLLGAVAGCVAVRERRWSEAFAWFALAYMLPVNARILTLPSWDRISVVIALSAAACVAVWISKPWAVAVAAMAGFFLMPVFVRNYPSPGNGELSELASWARSSTAKDAVFLFPDLGKDGRPGVFRSKALRAVYVDWKGGGQVNYLHELGEQWWTRWQETMSRDFDARDFGKYRSYGIDYVVLLPKNETKQSVPVYRNSGFVVYGVF
ncbi:MAG: hypothetical protein M3Z36_12545 [Acidobacteriota bacterium]|nr:hypothetical protein [Acidobacteriota bacterium]